MPRSYGTTNAQRFASAPAVGPAGDMYYDTTSNKLFVSDGTAWNESGGGGLPGPTGPMGPPGPTGAALVIRGAVPTYSALPSSGLQIGDAWFVDESGVLYIWMG